MKIERKTHVSCLLLESEELLQCLLELSSLGSDGGQRWERDEA
jgi:hypothetical protein